MAVGVSDRRTVVRLAAANALSSALSDRHAYVVPADVLMTIISTVLSPIVSQLNDKILALCTSCAGLKDDSFAVAFAHSAADNDDGEGNVVPANVPREISGEIIERMDMQPKMNIVDCDAEETEILLRSMTKVF
jgi:hypothetical protein